MKTIIGASLYGAAILSDVQSRRERYGERGVLVARHLPRLIQGGVNAVFLPAENMDEAESFFRELKESNGKLILTKSAKEVLEVVDRGGCACIFAASYETVGSHLDRLDLLYELGVRLFTMSGNRRNIFVDGCGERSAAGLSHLGIDLVRRLEELRILIDVSHISEKGFWDIFDTTKRAIIVASHSNAKRICDNARNLSDDQIKAIAERGGMVGLSMHPTLVASKDPTVEDVVQHMEYITKMIGSEGVGLGTDFVDCVEDVFRHKIKAMDPTGSLYGGALHTYPKGVETIEKVGNIFTLLEKKGFDSDTVRKLRGENAVRVLELISP